MTPANTPRPAPVHTPTPTAPWPACGWGCRERRWPGGALVTGPGRQRPARALQSLCVLLHQFQPGVKGGDVPWGGCGAGCRGVVGRVGAGGGHKALARVGTAVQGHATHDRHAVQARCYCSDGGLRGDGGWVGREGREAVGKGRSLVPVGGGVGYLAPEKSRYLGVGREDDRPTQGPHSPLLHSAHIAQLCPRVVVGVVAAPAFRRGHRGGKGTQAVHETNERQTEEPACMRS
jgi:hypothetical protein